MSMSVYKSCFLNFVIDLLKKVVKVYVLKEKTNITLGSIINDVLMFLIGLFFVLILTSYCYMKTVELSI